MFPDFVILDLEKNLQKYFCTFGRLGDQTQIIVTKYADSKNVVPILNLMLLMLLIYIHIDDVTLKYM